MKKYKISLKFSKSGTIWTRTRQTVVAESEQGAITLIESLYPHVKDIKVLSAK